MFGWTEQEAIGRPLPGVLGFARDSHFEPASSVRTKDGRHLNIDFHVTHPSSGGTLLVAAAGTSSKAEARLRELLEAAPDGIVEVDRDGRIVMLNKATERLFD